MYLEEDSIHLIKSYPKYYLIKLNLNIMDHYKRILRVKKILQLNSQINHLRKHVNYRDYKLEKLLAEEFPDLKYDL